MHADLAGSLTLQTRVHYEGTTAPGTLDLENVYLVRGLPATLVSASKLDKEGMSVHIGQGVCTVRHRNTGQVVLTSKEENGVYPISCGEGHIGPVSYLSFARGDSLENWHRRLGHISKRTI